VVRHERTHVLLPDELTGRHVSRVDRVQVVGPGGRQRLLGRLHEEVAEAGVPQLTEAGHARRDDRYFAHFFLRFSG